LRFIEPDLTYVDRLVKTMTDFSRDPAVLAAVRNEIADRIEMGR
jgi:hypothetical protein